MSSNFPIFSFHREAMKRLEKKKESGDFRELLTNNVMSIPDGVEPRHFVISCMTIDPNGSVSNIHEMGMISLDGYPKRSTIVQKIQLETGYKVDMINIIELSKEDYEKYLS